MKQREATQKPAKGVHYIKGIIDVAADVAWTCRWYRPSYLAHLNPFNFTDNKDVRKRSD